LLRICERHAANARRQKSRYHRNPSYLDLPA
jgi:hypothetical protein